MALNPDKKIPEKMNYSAVARKFNITVPVLKKILKNGENH